MLPTTSTRAPSTSSRGTHLTTITLAGSLIFTCCLLAWQSLLTRQRPLRIGVPAQIQNVALPKPPAITETLSLLFQSLAVAPAEPFFTYVDEPDIHRNLSLPPEPRFRGKLGKDVLILDMDTRPLPSSSDYEKGEFRWRKLDELSAGRFNHWTYAIVHGYDYKYINATEPKERFGSWHKPSAFANMIDDYKFVVFLDADATFRFAHLPLEWLLNFWEVQPHHSLTMAVEDQPWTKKNKDRFDRIIGNTGFVIVQNNNKTHEILKAWHECTTEVRYKGCARWKYERNADQSAFADYVRYDYDDYIKELPCEDANGSPGIKECEGRFVRHYWYEKFKVKDDYVENIMTAVTLPLQRIFSETPQTVIRNQTRDVIYRYETHNVAASNVTSNATTADVPAKATLEVAA